MLREAMQLESEGDAVAADIENFPPVVYVPVTTDAEGEQRLDVRITRDGRKALLVYSAMDRLAAWFGPSDWVLLTVEALQALYDREPFDLLLIDKRLQVEDPLAGEMDDAGAPR